MLDQADLDTISKIVADNGMFEWCLIGFNQDREHRIYSYLTDEAVLHIFHDILKTMLEMLEKKGYGDQASGRC